MTIAKTPPVIASELFYRGLTLDQIVSITGHANTVCLSSSLVTFSRKMRKKVLESGLPLRAGVTAFADKVGLDRDAAWYVYWAMGTGMRYLLSPTSRYVPEIIRLSYKFDYERNRQLPVSLIVSRLHHMGFEKATRQSIEVIRSQLRSFGHRIKAHVKTPDYDPYAGTIKRMSQRIERETFKNHGATALFWSRVLVRDVFVVKRAAAELSHRFLQNYREDQVLTGREFLASLPRTEPLRIAA